MEGKKYLERIYLKINSSDLIIFAIYLIQKNKEICTFERLVAECFNNFPKTFAFRRYPQWPDSEKLSRPLRTFREKGLITGGVGGRYSPGEIKLTNLGIEEAKHVGLILSQKKSIDSSKKQHRPPASIDEKLIYQLKTNKYFNQFLKNPKKFIITDQEFRSILRSTPETPERIVKQNFQYLKNVAKLYRENKIIEFLDHLESRFLK